MLSFMSNMILSPEFSATHNPVLNTCKKSIQKYGEVRTPTALVNRILDLFPISIFSNQALTWLDVGAGTGQFSVELFKRLDKGLAKIITSTTNRHRHILKNMIHMIEIQPEHTAELKRIFGEDANIWTGDFLCDHAVKKPCFDCIIGNPPFNSQGVKKVPTNTTLSKRLDGKTIWPDIIRKSMLILREQGYLAMITPSLWLHKDKAKIFDLMTRYKICYINSYTNIQTNTLFKGQAQTPTSFFLVKKTSPDGATYVYDQCNKEYVKYPIRPTYPLPVFGARVVSQLIPFVTAFGHTPVVISKSAGKNVTFSDISDGPHAYPVVKTCTLVNKQPVLSVKYSNHRLPYFGEPKIILAHKMYGLPYADITGKYGVSFRDNFIIPIRTGENAGKKGKATQKEKHDLQLLVKYLSSDLAYYVYEAAKYRMRYLDRYAFELLPNILKLPNVPARINNKTLGAYFGLSLSDQKIIKDFRKHRYGKTIEPL